MTKNLTHYLAALLVIVTLLANGCMRAISTSSVQPAALFTRQQCPGLEYDVIGEIKEGWTGYGFMGIPLNSTPDFAAMVTKEVQRQGGDAAMDVRISSNMFLFYALLYAQVHPRHRLTGKVIKYRSNKCTVAK